MKTRQVYYIIIVILIVIILWQLFKSSNENFVCSSQNSDKQCMANLYCAKKYMIPALADLESAYKKYTNNPNILGSISNNVTCETNFVNNDLSISDARQELSKCLSEYTKCDRNCKQEMHNMQTQLQNQRQNQPKYPDIYKAVKNFNSPVIGECINNY